ncbi:MAG: rhodanese-like domain-containing protein, partial [Deltaproteobacteria bacterium]|nr:rhodanese-like domain-containing protein [Deltaproteobacteria bacterium]
MEHILKNMTFDFVGQGKHKTTPEKLLGMEDVFFLDVRSRQEA